MILICGIPSEKPTYLVIEAAKKSAVPHLVLNQLHLEGTYLRARVNSQDRKPILNGEIIIDSEICDLANISGVYNRMMDHHSLPAFQKSSTQTNPDEAELTESISRFHQTIQDWMEITPARVMNCSSAMASNCSKPYQAQLILRTGFRVPGTLITNIPELVKDFLKEHPRVIYKSISAERSIVKELSQTDIPQLEKIRYLPTQFQEFIPGVDYRVHVVGDQAFACKIITEAVDYRYAAAQELDVQIQPTRLARNIEQQCLMLSRLFKLPLCGIDLKCTPDGDWYCFEVNPMPAFSFYEQQTGQPIAMAIVHYLNQPASM